MASSNFSADVTRYAGQGLVEGPRSTMRPMRARPMQLALALQGGHMTPCRRTSRRRRLIGLARCESPIERLLASALTAQGNFIRRTHLDHAWAIGAWSVPRTTLLAQAQCGRFRVDFGIVPPSWRLPDPPPIVVEVDGHDYHERTKEQAASDHSRDRWMAAAGVSILRFTGSEVWQDPDGCASEVLALVSQHFA